MHFVGLALVSLLASPAANAAWPYPVTEYEAVAQPPATDATATSDDMKLAADSYERMTVEVRLAGSGPFDFLVDTGSDRTSISRELATQLRLDNRATVQMHSATGESQVQMALVPELNISRKAVRDIDAPLLNAAHMGADGILGIDALRSQRILFDFGNRKLSIFSSRTPVTAEEEDAIVIRARRKEGRLVITNAKAAGERMAVVLDTGSQISVGNSALKRKLEEAGLVEFSGPIDLISVTGEALRGELAVIRKMEIGGVRLEGLTIVFADAHTFRLLSLDRRPAMLLGMNALKGFDKVSIDFDSRKLRFVLPDPKKRTS